MWELVRQTNVGSNEPAVIVETHGAFTRRLLQELLQMQHPDCMQISSGAYYLVELKLLDGSTRHRRVKVKVGNECGHIPGTFCCRNLNFNINKRKMI